jgi:glycosyltransferase involved in cell wall biosynthesis
MKIAIDMSLAQGAPAGIGRYSASLTQALKVIDPNDKYVLYQKPLIFQRALWLQTWVPIKLLADKADLFHATNLIAPLFATCPVVVTIHDLSSLLYPETHSLAHRIHMSLIPASAKKARKIIVPSLAVKKELEEHLVLQQDKIAVIHEGVGDEFRIISDRAKLSYVRHKYGLPDKYILYVGTLEPRKNLEKLVEGFNLAKERMDGHKMIIAGKKGWNYRAIFNKVAALKLEKEVLFLGYVPDEDLPAIYNLARVFVYPSLYEGFGLPILEAMACGTPVITSKASSLPEVAGDSAILIDPNDCKALAAAMEEIVSRPKLHNDLRVKGLDRSKKFTWSQCAKDTLEVYNDIIIKNQKALVY